MDNVPRLLLRFLLVPLGYFAGVLAGTLVILFGSWKIGHVLASDFDSRTIAAYGFVFAAPVLLVLLLSVMWLPCAIGIVLSALAAQPSVVPEEPPEAPGRGHAAHDTWPAQRHAEVLGGACRLRIAAASDSSI